MNVDELLSRARGKLLRVTAAEAAAELAGGALLVDIRPADERARDGSVPGATLIDRNVLEWRLDPASQWRSPVLRSPDQRVIVLCAEGFQSSLAAANLQELGLVNATDVIDGFGGWLAAGLPVARE